MMIDRVFILMFAYEIRFFHYTPLEEMKRELEKPSIESVLSENNNLNRGDIV